MKIFVEITEVSRHYVGGGTSDNFATLYFGSPPVGEIGKMSILDNSIEEPVRDTLGGFISGTGQESLTTRYVYPWHSSSQNVGKAMARRCRELEKQGYHVSVAPRA